MRIVHITSAHPADDHRIAYKECVSAVDRGYEVVLIASRGKDPGLPGVEVVMVESGQACSRASRIGRVAPRVVQAAIAAKPNIVHIHDPELLLWVPRLKRHAAVVFDAHEDIPAQLLSKGWVPRFLRPATSSATRIFLKTVSRHLDGVVYAEPSCSGTLGARHVAVVQNFPRLEEFPSRLRHRGAEASDTGRGLRVAYVGGISVARGAIDMVVSIGRLDERMHPRLTLAGPVWEPGLMRKLQELEGWSRVEYIPWLSRSQVAELLQESDIGLVPLHPVPNYVEAYPVKMFEYMAAGCAVVASDFPLWRSIIEDTQSGEVFPAGDAKSMARVITALAEDPERLASCGAAGRAVVERRFNWSNEEQKLLNVYIEVLSNRGQ